jgi:tight adherence protein C
VSVPVAAGALAGVASVLTVAALARARRPDPGASRRDRRAGAVLVQPLRALGSSRLGKRVGRERIGELLASAGAGWTADEIVGVKICGVVAGAIAAVVATPRLPILGVPLALASWRALEIVLARRTRRRSADAARELPLFLDLLAVATSSGLAPQLAVRVAAQSLRGPLGEELGLAIGRTDLGRRWRDEITGVAERLSLAGLRRVAAVLVRSDALGSSLADEVARLAADVREGRRSRAAERARTAPVKMLFPLVFLILPAFLLLTVVPVLLSTVRSIG